MTMTLVDDEQLLEATTEAAVVAHYARGSVGAKLMKVGVDAKGGTIEVLVWPDGKVEPTRPFTDSHREAPDARSGTAQHQTLDSFVQHTRRFADADSSLWAVRDQAAPSLTAVLDYHRAGPEGEPRFGEHRAQYQFPVSDEWQAWHQANRERMSQTEFAAFLEDRIMDVSEVVPGSPTADLAERLGTQSASASRLLELSRGLTVHEKAKVTQATKLASGETQVVFQTEHQTEHGAPLRVPGLFCVALPVFEGGDLFQVPVRLRYRVSNGAILWSIELHRADLVFLTAFNEAVEHAAKELGLPLFYGKPETYR